MTPRTAATLKRHYCWDFRRGVVTALFIVALLAWGYLPGPEMVKKNADVIYSVVWLQGISGIIGTLIGFVLATQLAKLAEVRYTFMVPIMFIFILMGAFSVNRDPIDLLVVVGFGLLAISCGVLVIRARQ